MRTEVKAGIVIGLVVITATIIWSATTRDGAVGGASKVPFDRSRAEEDRRGNDLALAGHEAGDRSRSSQSASTDFRPDLSSYDEPIATQNPPDEVNVAFGELLKDGYRFARPARTVLWKDDATYWIQWTAKADATVLWAYDPMAKKAVEILQVRDGLHKNQIDIVSTCDPGNLMQVVLEMLDHRAPQLFISPVALEAGRFVELGGHLCAQLVG